MKEYIEGYNASSIYQNPYWKNYPKEDCSIEEQHKARVWVDGYVEKLTKFSEQPQT